MGYCPVCGVEVSSPADIRFGEVFCSPAHAEEFVEKVRAARIQGATALAVADTGVQPPPPLAADARTRRDWKHSLKVGACVGAPLLAFVFIAGGVGAVLGAAGVLLPLLAFVACPLAMYFMMRSMSKMGQPEKAQDKGERQEDRR